MKEVSSNSFPCNIIPGENCFNCPYPDCIATSDAIPVSNAEKQMKKNSHSKVSNKEKKFDVSLSKKQKAKIALFSQNAYQSKMKTFTRSKSWIDNELKKFDSP